MRLKPFKSLVALSIPFLAAAALPAAQLSGNLTFNPVNGIIVTGSSLNFDNSTTGMPGSGLFNIVTGSTGSFATYIGQQGTIKDLNQTTTPVGATTNLPDFLVLPTSSSNIHFVLTMLNQGVFSSAACSTDTTMAAAGQTCTPNQFAVGGKSSLNLVNLSSSSFSASLQVMGYAYSGDPSTGISPFTGTFSTSFPNESFQQALSDLMTKGFVQTQSSAQGTFTVTFVPEPATMSMMLLGGLLVAGGAIRRRAQKA